MPASTFLETLILELPGLREHHRPTSKIYLELKESIKKAVADSFSRSEIISLPPFGEINLPYFRMGAVDSLDLFGLDELIIFSYYWVTRDRYKKALDIGGNLGLHSIVMDRAGFQVTTFEPDPIHFEILRNNLQRNQCQNVTPINAAISSKAGSAQFVRVLGNTTSSHIQGSKTPYGDLETFPVKVEAFCGYKSDLVKMDVEGHEKEIILSTTSSDWANLDAMIEVGSRENAQAIFSHLQSIGICAFSQKNGWGKVTSANDIPVGHKEGSLFITSKSEMFW